MHKTLTSSLCSQLFCPIALCSQSSNEVSEPLHFTSSSHIIPLPAPKYALLRYTLPIYIYTHEIQTTPQLPTVEYPNCLHTTSALMLDQ